MNIINYMPPEKFDIRVAMGIKLKRSVEIEQAVKDIYEFVVQEKGLFEMSTIIEDCLNTIPKTTKEAIWTIVLIIKYEDLAKLSKSKIIN